MILFALREILPAAFFLVPLYLVLHKTYFHDIQKSILYCVFSFYLAAVYALVGMPNITYIRFELYGNLIPLIGMIDDLKNSILNILLFVPLGIFLPVLWRKYRVMRNTVFLGFVMSLAIEVLQVFTLRATDVNDVITNTLGTLVGFFVAQFLIRHFPIFRNLIFKEHEKGVHTVFASAFVVMFFLQPFAVMLL